LAIALLVVVFAGGVAAGVIADRFVLMRQARVLPSGGIDLLTRHLATRLDRKLDLTEAQEAEVRAILDRRKKNVFTEWNGLHSRLHREIEEANGEIAALLTSEQREEFNRMHRRWRRHGPGEPKQGSPQK